MARRVAKQKRKALKQLWGNTTDFSQVISEAFKQDMITTTRLRRLCFTILVAGILILTLPVMVCGIGVCKEIKMGAGEVTQTPTTKDLVDSPIPKVTPVQVTNSEREMIARVVHSEAGNQPDSGQRAVAQVIVNRTRHPKYPSTVSQVVYQRNQFQGIHTKKYHSPIPKRVLDNVDYILAGNKVIPDNVTNFKSVHCKTYWNLPLYGKIGDHNFYYSNTI